MSSKKKKLLIRTILTANLGCGCATTKLSEVHQPTPIPKSKSSNISQNPNPCPNSSPTTSCDKNFCSLSDEDHTSTTFSLNNVDTTPHCSEPENHPNSSKIIDSIAVVKDSNNPYQDFRDSMLQMILEKEIYSKDDLQELLKCFLELNSECHRDVIVQAFTEICNCVLSKKQGSCGSDAM